jgi:putative ABC transport system permease protein
MILQCLKMAWQAISGNKLRSFLTMLGIIIGVTALVVMVSLVNGATGKVTSEIESLGTDMLTAYVLDDKGNPLQYSDMPSIEGLDAVKEVAPSQSGQFTAKQGYEDAQVTLYGVSPSYFRITGQSLTSGRFIKTPDLDNTTYVCVLGDKTADKFFGKTDVLGETLRIDGREFRVVGVLEAQKSSFGMFGFQYDVYAPFTVVSRMTGQMSVTTVYASSADPNNASATEQALSDFFLKRFKDDSEAFYIQNMSSFMDSISQVTGTMSLLLGGIAAISLLVGGIGIMNIMLVSVTERTREIGIRKAIGAGRGTIMLQFLIEALMLSLIGCAFGLILSQGILLVAERIALNAGQELSFSMSPNVVALAVLFSSGIGLLFGLYPANKAARKHPIEALRYQE